MGISTIFRLKFGDRWCTAARTHPMKNAEIYFSELIDRDNFLYHLRIIDKTTCEHQRRIDIQYINPPAQASEDLQGQANRQNINSNSSHTGHDSSDKGKIISVEDGL